MERFDPPARLRPDVVTARSRMRTKYGAQREIGVVGTLLEPGEVLLHLAVTSGPAHGDRRQHGLLALSDARLIYVPRGSSRGEVQESELGRLLTMTWSTGPGSGTLSLVGGDFTRSYAGLARADGRDLIISIRTVRPAVRYVETPA